MPPFIMNSFVKSLLNVIPHGMNERNDQLLLRQDGRRLCCINLDGHVIYSYDILGFLGLAVDQQGHVYISGGVSSGVDKLYGILTWKSNYCFICTWYYSNTPRFTGKRYSINIDIKRQ
jgi:hypothetical protein